MIIDIVLQNEMYKKVLSGHVERNELKYAKTWPMVGPELLHIAIRQFSQNERLNVISNWLKNLPVCICVYIISSMKYEQGFAFYLFN